jgi:hypothetical protein
MKPSPEAEPKGAQPALRPSRHFFAFLAVKGFLIAMTGIQKTLTAKFAKKGR